MKQLIRKIFEAGVHSELDEFEKRSIRLLNRLMLVAFLGTVGFTLVDLSNGIYEILILFVAVSLVFFFEQLLARRRKFNAAKVLVFSFLLGWGLLFSIAVGDKAHPQYMLLPLAMFPLLFFRSIKLSYILFALIIATFIAIVYLQTRVSPILILPPHLAFPYTIIAAFMMMLVIFMLTLYSRSLTKEYENIILQKNDELSGAYKDIKDSITYAKRLQEAILPSQHLIQRYLPQSFILYKPKDIVAGDFYWFHAGEEKEHRVFIAAADCTGHGVPGAMVSVVCSNALNRAVIELEISEPGKILDKVRELVIDTFEKSGSEVKDGMDISLASIDLRSYELKWAGANNPLWYISNGEFRDVSADKQPIGKFENAREFTTHTLKLNKNDTLFLFTDGYADQFGGPKGKKFKYKQLSEVLTKNSASSSGEQRKNLDEIFENWRGNTEQIDDVCIIGIRL